MLAQLAETGREASSAEIVASVSKREVPRSRYRPWTLSNVSSSNSWSSSVNCANACSSVISPSSHLRRCDRRVLDGAERLANLAEVIGAVDEGIHRTGDREFVLPRRGSVQDGL